MLNTDGLDRPVLHAAALLCFIAPCAAGREVKTDGVCLRREDIFDLSVCQYVDGNQGCVFSRVFLHRASNDLSTCWAFQNDFYFDLRQQGMEWSRLGLPPSEPLWTHPVQRWDATTLIYYSEVIHRLWIKRQLNYVVGAAKAGPQQFRTDDLREPRWRDNWDRQTDRLKDRNVWSLWLLQATSCSSDQFYAAMKNRYPSAVCSQGRWYSLRYLQKAQGQRWELSFEGIIVLRCAARVSGRMRRTPFEKKAEICTTMTQKSLFSVQNSHSEGIKHFCDTLTWHRSTLFFWYFL